MGCVQSKTEDVAATNQPEDTVTPVETEPVAEEPKVEEPVAEEPKVEEPVAEEPKVEEPVAEEPKVEEEPAAAEPEAESATPDEPAKEVYKVTGHEIDEAGVVFYTVEAVEGDASFKKRFSEFKALVVALGSPKSLPALPGSGLGAKLRGKHNPALIQERETQLAVVLNAIANDAELAEKEPFKKFVE